MAEFNKKYFASKELQDLTESLPDGYYWIKYSNHEEWVVCYLIVDDWWSGGEELCRQVTHINPERIKSPYEVAAADDGLTIEEKEMALSFALKAKRGEIKPLFFGTGSIDGMKLNVVDSKPYFDSLGESADKAKEIYFKTLDSVFKVRD